MKKLLGRATLMLQSVSLRQSIGVIFTLNFQETFLHKSTHFKNKI